VSTLESFLTIKTCRIFQYGIVKIDLLFPFPGDAHPGSNEIDFFARSGWNNAIPSDRLMFDL